MLRTLWKATALATAAVMVWATVALASELNAELQGGGQVEVNQGGSAPFSINLSATGSLECGKTATATVPTSYAINASGVVSSSGTSAAVSFTGTGDPAGASGNCAIQGGGTVSASVSADAATPATTYSVNVPGTTNNAGISKGKLVDEFAQSITVNVSAGSTSPADTTPPSISYVLNPAAPDGNNGWYKSNVTLTWTVTESESPSSLVKTGCVDQNIIADQAATTYSCSATSDGGSAGPVTVTIKRDGTAPTAEVTGFEHGDVFTKGAAGVPPTVGCQFNDNLSGIDSAASSGPTLTAGGLTSNGVGSETYKCIAFDNAGNSSFDEETYSVHYGGVSGILQPINPDNSSVFSRGRAVPVKFQLGGDEYFGYNTSGWALQRVQLNCSSLADALTPESVPSNTPSTQFRYDATADQYIYNADFRDKAAGTCWKVRATLDSGQVLESAIFKLQK